MQNRFGLLRVSLAVAVCAAVVAFVSAPAQAQAKKDKKEEPVRTQLDNGLKVIVIPTKRHSVVVTAMIYRIGTGDDMPGKAGLAHLISRVVPYAASQDYKEGTGLAALQKVGFQKNAEKDVGSRVFRDATCYYSILNSDKVELALKIEAERVTGLMFAPELVKREALKATEIVHAQMQEPEGAMLARVLGLVFTVHPYRFPVLGFERDITTIGVDQARAHYDTFYMSNSATLVVIGKVDPESVVGLVNKYYGSFPAGALVETVRKEEPPQTGGRSTVLRFDVPAERIMLGYAGAALASKMQAALLVVTDYLNDELKKRLVDGGKATEVSVSYDWLNTDPGPLVIKAVMPEGKEHVEALELIHATIGEIGDKGLDEKL
ncbi:MAG: pitrilysin family protein, partial [Planctomycetota bacterium]|nr:pitrilysin family protein [Planctomycetota bacterium]